MSWLTNIPPKIRALVNKPNVPEHLWKQCPGCEQMIFHRELDAALQVCQHCGHHMRISAPRRIEIMMDDDSWHVVRNTPGVTGFVSSEDEAESRPKPVPLEEHEVEKILSQMEAEAPRVKVGYIEGQSVRITDGPFTDFIGVVDQVMTDRGKLSILVSFFGRETPVELDFLQVEKL